MAGTIPLSLTQQLDEFGAPLSGGKLYTIQAGTVATPQNSYQDSALTLPWPNPIILDASGRLPQFFLADGSIKVRLEDSEGNTKFTADGIIVTGASSGGGGGSPVDPTTVLTTGDIKLAYGTSILSGFVRANAKSIGSATSGATERANADCQALFILLWNNDLGLAVSGGRGASAAADWAANKTINLPDGRGKAPFGLCDMGNVDNGLFSGVAFDKGSAISLGSITGRTRRTLLTANLPAYTPAGTFSASLASGTISAGAPASITSGSFSGTLNSGNAGIPVRNFAPTAGAGNDTSHISVGNNAGADAGTFNQSVTGTVSGSTLSGSVSGGTVTGSVSGSIVGTAQGGSSTAFDAVSPALLITIYLKL